MRTDSAICCTRQDVANSDNAAGAAFTADAAGFELQLVGVTARTAVGCFEITVSGEPQAANDASRNNAVVEALRRLHKAGFAVLPATGKSPEMLYQKLRRRMPLTAVLRRVEKMLADGLTPGIVAIPGLSTVWRDGKHYKLIVIDCDAHELVAWAEFMFGSTPGRVRTRRGMHLYYLVPADVDLPTALVNLGNIRAAAGALKIDVKHGQSIVVLPPSRHENERTFQYAWDGCDETVLERLPLLPLDVLDSLLRGFLIKDETSGAYTWDKTGSGAKCATRSSETPVGSPRRGDNGAGSQPLPLPPSGLGDGETRLRRAPRIPLSEHGGSRRNGLNRHLCSVLPEFIRHGKLDSAALLEHALVQNSAAFSAGSSKGALPIDEVQEIVSLVDDAYQLGKIGTRAGKRIRRFMPTPAGGSAWVDGDEIDVFRHLGNVGFLAYYLLALLRAEHTTRVERGETFALVPEAMVSKMPVPTVSVSAGVLRQARDLLLALGYLVKVSEHRSLGRRGWSAAQYTLSVGVEIVTVPVERVDADGLVHTAEIKTTSTCLAQHGAVALQALIAPAVDNRPRAADGTIVSRRVKRSRKPKVAALAAENAATSFDDPVAQQQPEAQPKPWEVAGASRAKWYRQQKAAREVEQGMSKRMTKAEVARMAGGGTASQYVAAVRRGRARQATAAAIAAAKRERSGKDAR